ncbi:sulfite exporter TauE/SafE family protein [Bradyrhizobium sp. U87765 SZCCT0131]|uniref:sulfite exporter TauE/SafE family protein n=1 Tax=unclassified Bradyrhizobium TaxID=2631580 RepID=UPI001BA89B0C|nr:MULTISPECIES: sulfite exporter TauE/SafE family protein [unclassified Bradyrhizobium]MBR1216752.1 sulfite exporter TauE/SafE family protein [Bradyrhizobium sp. U87765 SZCCT0131]MBR1259492.1 sulfite exporter TauE/SafE family protein [Bradyrhizobium sp. U87765 SZCCT0134]MBR1305633.1 sulfite exporter TauE/SafE family protein [Bradyrhizobium sp. U87765 SZCCT0110]MBR1322000.1 sulfite exporter TauE/SafE family protein [Bradyrhizobium sp. U87765 SZCCT0109]MBR1350722.1 sulfite exporter TauE/SafE fa
MNFAALLPSDISPHHVLAIGAIALIAGAARGFSGFGSALIFMPLASTFAAPSLVAGLLLVIDSVAAVPLIPGALRHADRRPVTAMVLGAVVGVPIGTYALTRLDPVVTRWIISAFVVAMLALIASGWRYRGTDRGGIAMAVGSVSGFCGGLAQTGGPPVVAYWLGRPIEPQVVRANIVLFFAGSDVVSVASYLVAGLLTSDVLKLALLIGPVFAFGLWLGAQMFGKASETLFRTICYALIALAAVVGLPLFDGLLR